MRRAARPVSRNIELTQEELDAIYVRTPDPVRRSVSSTPVKVEAKPRKDPGGAGGPSGAKRRSPQEEYLLVDGYNIIFASRGMSSGSCQRSIWLPREGSLRTSCAITRDTGNAP